MLGGYCKGSLLRHKIVELMNVTTYDKIKIHDNEQQVKCMLDLELIDHEQADVILNMYKRLEQEVDKDGQICEAGQNC